MKARFTVTIRIVPYEERHIVAVSEFNNRLKVKNVAFQFPERPIPKWLPPKPNRDIYQEYFVAVDENRDVRGGYILKHQQFLVNGNVVSIGDYQLPLSEGIIDQKYNMIGLRLITDALNRQPLMYALGMGGQHQPLPKFLKAMRWMLNEVPFYFKIEHPFRFLRNIQVLRTKLWRRLALDAAALSGVGWGVWKFHIPSWPAGVSPPQGAIFAILPPAIRGDKDLMGKKNSLSITDNRTGRIYEVAIENDTIQVLT